jgi:hypothetical protein
MLSKLTAFINSFQKNKKMNKETIDCIKQLLTFKSTKEQEKKEDEDNDNDNVDDREKIYKTETFFKNIARSIVEVYPNMIYNNVRYDRHKDENEEDDDAIGDDEENDEDEENA